MDSEDDLENQEGDFQVYVEVFFGVKLLMRQT